MVQSFTVAELAKRIRRPGEADRVTTDRIRNWTREGLLTTHGEKNPGTGKSRLYARSAIVEAVFMQVFVDCLGVAVSQARPLLAHAKREMLEAMKSDTVRGSFMLIARSIGSNEFFVGVRPRKQVAALLADSGPFDTYTLIDFDRLVPRLIKEGE